MAGYDLLKARLTYAAGGNEPTQENINTQNKLESMRSSLTNAEQMEHVRIGAVLDGEQAYDDIIDVLINPDKLALTYDQKEISVDPTAEVSSWTPGLDESPEALPADYKITYTRGKRFLEEGNIVRWYRTQEYDWWNEKNYSDWLVIMRDMEEKAYIRGRIRRCNHSIEVNGHIYEIAMTGPQETSIVWDSKHNIEDNELNYKPYFFVTKDAITNAFFKRFQKVKFDGHRWQVAAVDRYSSDGVMKVFIDEYFDNSLEDAAVQVTPEKQDHSKPYIDGPRIVYPFDTGLKYVINNLTAGKFVVNSNKVKIDEMDQTSCVIEITTGKAGSFEISYQTDDGEIVSLPVTIKSV